MVCGSSSDSWIWTSTGSVSRKISRFVAQCSGSGRVPPWRLMIHRVES